MSELSPARLASVQRIKDKAKSTKAPDAPNKQADDLTSIRRLLGIMATAVCFAMLWAAQAILVPTAMAVVLALVLAPVVGALEKWHVPTPVAAVMVVFVAAASIAGTASALAPSVTDWVNRAPEIAQAVQRKLQPIKPWLASYKAASSELKQITSAGTASGAPAVAAAPSRGSSMLEIAPVALAQTLYVIALALFLIVVRKVYRKRFILLPSDRADRLRVARIMNESIEGVSQYLFMMMCVSVGLAVVTGICFAIAGIEYPVLWGVVFGAACFIPYIGPTVVILACAVVQFATQDTLAAAAVGPLILLGINTIESNAVTPLLVSRRVAVSAIAIFLTIAIFVWLWGAAASIVAVPLLILFSAIAKNVPSLQPYALLLQAEHDNPEEIANPARLRFFSEPTSDEPATWRSYLRGRLAGLVGHR